MGTELKGQGLVSSRSSALPPPPEVAGCLKGDGWEGKSTPVLGAAPWEQDCAVTQEGEQAGCGTMVLALSPALLFRESQDALGGP